MGGALRKTMVYLGLAEDEERYDGYDLDDLAADEDGHDVDEHDLDSEREPAAAAVSREVSPAPARTAAVTPIGRGRVTAGSRLEAQRQELHRISTIHPRTYNEAKTIGEAFRAGTPVIMNLGEMDDADAKRLVDFAAGLVFGLHGSIERVTSKVFLLSPAHVEVTPADAPKVPERAFFNQS